MDDVSGYIANTIGFTQIFAHGVRAFVLVHDVSFGYQCRYSWILFIGNRRLGLVKS